MCQIKYYDPSTVVISWEIREQPQVHFICGCAFEIVSVPYISNKIFIFLAGKKKTGGTLQNADHQPLYGLLTITHSHCTIELLLLGAQLFQTL